MEIIIGKNAGFCFGAKRAVVNSIDSAKKEKVCCLGEIIHNQNVTDQLKTLGIEFINNIEQATGTTIIRAHGEPKSVYKKAKEMGIKLIDLTCPSVLKIHGIVNKYAKEGFYIIITGKINHPEVIGIKSYTKNKCKIIANLEELTEVLDEISKEKKVLLISQTTYNSRLFKEIANTLKEKLNSDTDLVIKNTICLTTENRQEETKKIAQNVNVMIIVGDTRSANTTELYKIASKYCPITQFVSSFDELNLSLINKNDKIGIMAGASTPKEDIIKIKELLLKNYN